MEKLLTFMLMSNIYVDQSTCFCSKTSQVILLTPSRLKSILSHFSFSTSQLLTNKSHSQVWSQQQEQNTWTTSQAVILADNYRAGSV